MPAEAKNLLEKAGLSMCPPGFNYTGSLAVHCYDNGMLREMQTVTQPHLMNMNDSVINMHLSNFAIAVRKMLTGRRPSTLDKTDRR